jgi:hypothetical protein
MLSIKATNIRSLQSTINATKSSAKVIPIKPTIQTAYCKTLQMSYIATDNTTD